MGQNGVTFHDTKRTIAQSYVELAGKSAIPNNHSSGSFTSEYPYAEKIKEIFQEKPEITAATTAPQTCPSAYASIWMLMKKHPEAIILLICLAWLRRSEKKSVPAVSTLAVVGYMGLKAAKMLLFPPKQTNERRHIDLSNHKP